MKSYWESDNFLYMVKKSRAVITGGKGFIGTHLTEELRRRNYQVDVFDLVDGMDITNRRLVLKKLKGFDIIFHLAGILGTHELNCRAYEAALINILGTVNALDAAKGNGSRIVLAAKPNPWSNVYSITKKAAENFFSMYRSLYGVDSRIGRFFSIYGPGQKTVEHGVQKAVPTFILKALRDEPIPIFGTGEQTADFIYISDTVEAFAILGCEEKLSGKAVEIGTGKQTTVNFLAKRIIELTKSKSKILHLPMRSGEPLNARVVADTTKMEKLLKYHPIICLDEGLKKTIQWYKMTYL